jgi:4-nitrophenyl phosphatase
MSEAPPTAAVLARLRRVRGFVLDMDGTLVLGDRDNRGISPPWSCGSACSPTGR